MGSQQVPDTMQNSYVASSTKPMVRMHHSKIFALVRALDVLLVVFLLLIISAVFQSEWSNSHSGLCLLAAISFSFFAEINEIYYLWRGMSIESLSYRLLAAWLITAMIVTMMTTFFGLFSDVSQGELYSWLIITPVVVVGFHWARRVLLTRLRDKPSQRRAAVVGANDLGARLNESFVGQPWLGYRFHGFYDDRFDTVDISRRLVGEQVSVSGDFEQLYNDAKEGKIDIVFIALPMRAEHRIHALVNRLADTTVSTYIIPDVFNFDLLHSRFTSIQGIPALSIYDSPMVDHGWSKRLEDLVLSSLALLFAAVPMALIALGVKLTSAGPVFFKQTRYGMCGEKIKVWKFRSMSVCEDGDVVRQASSNDPRITPFGSFLRRTSLDELPQIFNVLLGTMSLVGPRPHAVAHNEFYRGQIKGYMLRHKVKPGITGLAQISGYRGETQTLDKMAGRIAHDLEYIRHWSLLLDLKIMWLTLFRGFVGQHAY